MEPELGLIPGISKGAAAWIQTGKIKTTYRSMFIVF
jgi:hypothetical protein